MQNKKYLYGELNKDTARSSYVPVNSDSVRLTIDNNARTIRADVIWDGVLGYTFHKAYPGSDGERNYQKILQLTAQLTDEISKATASRKETETRLTAAENYLDETSKKLQLAVKEEEDQYEKIHQLTVDVSTLQDTDKHHRSNLQSLDKAIKNVLTTLNEEITLRDTQWNAVNTELELEIKRAKDLDEEYGYEIKNNSNRITTLQIDLVNLISKKVEELETTDNDLKSNQESESIERQDKDSYLEQLIIDESHKSKKRDQNLQEQLDNFDFGKDTYVEKITTDGSTVAYIQQGESTSTIPVSVSSTADSLVKRDSSGNIQISEEISTLSSHSAVSKSYVDDLIESFKEVILEKLEDATSYKFIDGGNAPIQ